MDADLPWERGRPARLWLCRGRTPLARLTPGRRRSRLRRKNVRPRSTRPRMGPRIKSQAACVVARGPRATAHRLCAAARGLCIAAHELCTAAHELCIAAHRLCSAAHGLCFIAHRLCIAAHELCVAAHELCVIAHRLCIAARGLCNAAHRLCKAAHGQYSGESVPERGHLQIEITPTSPEDAADPRVNAWATVLAPASPAGTPSLRSRQRSQRAGRPRSQAHPGHAIASAKPGSADDSSSMWALAMPSSSRASTPLTVVSCWSARYSSMST